LRKKVMCSLSGRSSGARWMGESLGWSMLLLSRVTTGRAWAMVTGRVRTRPSLRGTLAEVRSPGVSFAALAEPDVRAMSIRSLEAESEWLLASLPPDGCEVAGVKMI